MKHTVKILTLVATLVAVIGLAGCSPNIDAKPQEQNTQQETWDDGVVTTEPTCTTEGVKTYTCTNGETRTEIIPALGHDYGDWEITKEATCTEDGEKKHICKREGCGHFETEVIPAAHDYQGGYCEREGCTDPWEFEDGYKATLKVFIDNTEFKKFQSKDNTAKYELAYYSFADVNKEVNLTDLIQQKTIYTNYKVIKYITSGSGIFKYDKLKPELIPVQEIGNIIPGVLLEPKTE